MRRILVAMAALLVFTLSPMAGEPYKVVLKDGSTLQVDAKPVVGAQAVTLLRGGIEYTLKPDQIDFAATEKANPKAPALAGPGTPEAKPARVYTDEDLPRLRETSPLADEGGGPAASSGAAAAPAKHPERKATQDARLLALYQKEDDLEGQRSDWLRRLADFQAQYDRFVKEDSQKDYAYDRSPDASTRGAEGERMREEEEARRANLLGQVSSARAQVARIDRDLDEVRGQILAGYDSMK
jgi:hypothetical protein